MWWKFRKFLKFFKEKKPRKLSDIDSISKPSNFEMNLSFENEIKNFMKQ
jgi:hypothetical protein